MLNQESCWQSVRNRDAAQDGKFFVGVMTTGVYCRPSCPSRPALRKNVRFYETPAEAERDGLRPCLRCHPLATVGADPNTERVRHICRFIEEHSDDTLKLSDLAARAGLSPFHFQRSFKAIVGLTPKQYLEAERVKKLKGSLRSSKDVAEAVYDAGYGSSSRVYERADTRLGMTPNQYRKGGHGVTITYVAVESPVGLMMVGATDRGLCFVQFGETEADLFAALEREYPSAKLEPMKKPCHPDFQKWIDALTAHLAGAQPRVSLPLDIRATAFQMRVWNYLQSIPYGHVQSYGEVAAGIGQPAAVRAVARACATNPVAVVIPCHRVIRGTGELGGYRWGLSRKRTLIDQERAANGSAARPGRK
ncbi:MAG TPA: bifunctional DNA-binding transcriptional regulator/O6-methylguanine-DNA methyltransferase Ada [Blastocatellia bacterium]|nr:bifunctional DNA-binding transcriptional regulator/O6-methylguanine-DNA methyltransferase Ada [Blastocatellia bacterium]